MFSSISNRISSWFRSNSTNTPDTSSTYSKPVWQDFLFSLVGEKSLAADSSHPPAPMSSKKISNGEITAQLAKVTEKINKLSRSWFSFVHKGRIQDLQTTQKKLQEELFEARQQEMLQAAKETFSKNFQSTFSTTASDCAHSLYEIYHIDPREAATLFLSEAQSNPKRAAAILLTAKNKTFPKNGGKQFISNLLSAMNKSLAPQEVKTLIEIFKIILTEEITSETNDTLFRGNDSATIPLFRCIAKQVLDDALPRISTRNKQLENLEKEPTTYWKTLSQSLSQKPLNSQSRNFFGMFRDTIKNQLNSDDTGANRMLLSILTNRVLAPSISNPKYSSAVMQSVSKMGNELLKEICNKLIYE